MSNLLHHLSLGLSGLLYGCNSQDEQVLNDPTNTQALQDETSNADTLLPVLQVEQKTESFWQNKLEQDQLLETIICGRDGSGLFANTRAIKVYELLGTAVYYDAHEKQINAEALIRRRFDQPSSENIKYGVGDWLGNDWQIIDIQRAQVLLLNQCGYTEALLMDIYLDSGQKNPNTGEFISKTGKTIKIFADGSIHYLGNERNKDNPVSAIYRYNAGTKSYDLYTANEVFTGRSFSREQLEEEFGFPLQTP